MLSGLQYVWMPALRLPTEIASFLTWDATRTRLFTAHTVLDITIGSFTIEDVQARRPVLSACGKFPGNFSSAQALAELILADEVACPDFQI